MKKSYIIIAILIGLVLGYIAMIGGKTALKAYNNSRKYHFSPAEQEAIFAEAKDNINGLVDALGYEGVHDANLEILSDHSIPYEKRLSRAYGMLFGYTLRYAETLPTVCENNYGVKFPTEYSAHVYEANKELFRLAEQKTPVANMTELVHNMFSEYQEAMEQSIVDELAAASQEFAGMGLSELELCKIFANMSKAELMEVFEISAELPIVAETIKGR